MKKLLSLISLAMILMAALPAFAADVHVSPSGTSYWNEAEAFNGYTLFSSLTGTGDGASTQLIDMEGNVVHSWKMLDGYSIAKHAYLLENGNLVRGITPHSVNGVPAAAFTGIEYAGSIYQELDWNGNVIWQARHPKHKDITKADFLAITGLSEAQLHDGATVTAVLGDKQNEVIPKHDYSEHHDFKKIWNKKLGKWTVIFPSTKYIPAELVLRAGVNIETASIASSFPNSVGIDCISEVDVETGELVWEWSFWDHLIQNHDASQENWYEGIANIYYNGDIEEAFYRRLDVNVLSNQGIRGPESDMTHVNSLSYNVERDEIVLNSRFLSEFYVINHNTTTEEARGVKGDFLYRFGSPYNYASDAQLGEGNGRAEFPTFFSAGLTQIWGAHDVRWIDEGLPGAGNILIFNNGAGRVGSTFSSVLEINPFDAYGNYVRELDAGYSRRPAYPSGNTAPPRFLFFSGQTPLTVSNQIVWGYSGLGTSFFSYYISGAQRLPNGNTLICSGLNGHMFEVTKAGKVVWEYMSPINPGYISEFVGMDADGEPLLGGDGPNRGAGANAVYRCYRYAPDYPGLAGKRLISQGKLEEETDPTGFGFSGGIGGSGGSSGAGGGGGGY